MLREKKNEAAMHRMVPLEAENQKILETGSLISKYCLSLTELPSSTSLEAHELLISITAPGLNTTGFPLIGVVQTSPSRFFQRFVPIRIMLSFWKAKQPFYMPCNFKMAVKDSAQGFVQTPRSQHLINLLLFVLRHHLFQILFNTRPLRIQNTVKD